MITREDIHGRIMAELKRQAYGHPNAQPSRLGLAWAIVHTLWDAIDQLQRQLHLVRGAGELAARDVARLRAENERLRRELDARGLTHVTARGDA